MMANLRMANLVNQAEGLLLALSTDYQGYEIGASLLGEIAKTMNSQPSSQLIIEDALVDALPMALASVGTAGELSLDDQLAMFQLMADLDESISAFDQDMDFASVMEHQREIINNLEVLFDDLEEGDRNLTLRSHQLTVNYQTGGYAGESGNYPYGSKVAISALPEEGYHFDKWTGNGLEDVNASSTFVMMLSDRNLTAHFTPKIYGISLFAGAGGTVSGEGNYSHGESIVLNATPAEGWEFLEWRSNGLEFATESSLLLEAEKSISLYAHFTKIVPEFLLTSAEGGTVLRTEDYEYGEIVYIQAIPNEGYVFDKWIGDGVEDVNASFSSVLMSQDRNIQATFLLQPPQTFTLSLESVPVIAGNLDGHGFYEEGAIVQISAKPLPGYKFDQWLGNQVTEVNEANTTMVLSANTILQAQFTAIEYELDLHAEEGGTVLGGGTYPFGTNVNITAIPYPGFHFLRWEGDNISTPYDSSTQFEISGNATIEAVFQPQTYTLEINGTNGGVCYGEGTYDYGANVKIIAQPSTGYRFDGWVGDEILQTDSLSTWVAIKQDTYISANFVLIDNYFTPGHKIFRYGLTKKIIKWEKFYTESLVKMGMGMPFPIR